MITLKINQELTCEKICQSIQKLLQKNNHTDSILVIEIRHITSTTDEIIPKLTYKAINEQ